MGIRCLQVDAVTDRPLHDGFELRWFTPATEVDLCGHATLASAHVLWTEAGCRDAPIRFQTKSGVLTASRQDDFIELDFPATPAQKAEPPVGLLDALGVRPSFVGRSKFDIFVFVFVYDTHRDTWQRLPRLLPKPTNDIRVVIHKKRLYALGGENIDPATNNTTRFLRIGDLVVK